MPAKRVHLPSGRTVEIKAVKLPNGNLSIPQRAATDRTVAEWVEVGPTDPRYQRWLPVAE